ncbi:MAG: class I SAM-dependent methyltransferase [Ilumatobacteraceae bacterium]|nr:class I SAM-dependent methyltransferase [Ilumatobacteraceae bacterium]
MTSERWFEYWREHADNSTESHPLAQVQRVLNQVPISDEAFEEIAFHTIDQLRPAADSVVLDLCSGNGLLTARLQQAAELVVAVEFVDMLLRLVRENCRAGAVPVLADARDVAFRSGSFDRVLVAAALQHFSTAEVVNLFARVRSWLRPGGVFVLTDVLDQDKQWRFFDSQDRESTYFNNLARGTPILGTWFRREWLTKLATHSGFIDAVAQDQPDNFPYAHYRFDFSAGTPRVDDANTSVGRGV